MKKSFFDTKFRVVPDSYCGYEIQYKKWYFLFWVQWGFVNTFYTRGDAVSFIKKIQLGKSKIY